MADAETRIEDHLYEGESVQQRLDIGATRVVVTDNRVFAFRAGEGAVRHAERPNVAGVEPAVTGSRWSLRGALMLIVVALPLVAAGLFIDVQELANLPEFDENVAEDIGAGGLTDLVEWLLTLAANLDLVLLASGVLLLLVAAVFFLWYFGKARVPTFAIRLAGDASDIHIPRKNAPEDARDRLERAILGTPVGSAASEKSLADAGPDEALPESDAESLPDPESGDSRPELDDQEKRPLPEPGDIKDTDDDSERDTDGDTGLF